MDETPTKFVEAISQVRGETEPEEEEEEEETRKGPPVLAILVAIAGALLLIGALFVGIAFLFKVINPTEDPSGKVAVPSLINQPYVDADTFREAYPELSVMNLSILRQYSDEYEKDMIMSTDPKEGKKLSPGDTLELVVSNGPHMVQIPEVTTNEDSNTYETRAKNAGFEVIRTPIMSDSVPEGCIVRTSPAYPEMASYGSVITLFISNGSDPVEPQKVPNLDQLTLESAKMSLQNSGFILGEPVSKINHDTYEAGRVVSQTPAADELLEVGGTVQVVVASGFRDAKLVALPLPEVNSTISLEVYIDAKLDNRPEYSSDLKNILPSAIAGGKMYFTFVEQKASYKVTFRIKGESAPTYQNYASFTINGLDGTWAMDMLNPYGTSAPTTTPTTVAPTTQAPTTQAPTTQAPTTQAPTTEPTTEPTDDVIVTEPNETPDEDEV